MLVPGDPGLSSCLVRFDIRPDQRYDERLAAGIRDDKQRAGHGFQSVPSRVGGAEAVLVSYIDRSWNRIATLYVHLPEGLLRWQFAALNTLAGRECEVTFRAIAGESEFKRLN
jgi:hypothetical protein